MILLGLCMMKFNVMIEMVGVIWFEFCDIYLFVFVDQIVGYVIFFLEFEDQLVEIMGFFGVLFQLNVGLQGEYVGMFVICVYYEVCFEGY